jgi:hypothetical protein
MRILTEAALDQEFGIKAKLASGGDYGCMCVVFDGDVVFDEPVALEDTYFYTLNRSVPGDVGTILFTGNVTCTGHASISDRLMCLIVLGDFRAPKLSVYETEMLVCGALEVGELQDRDGYLTALNRRSTS